MTSPLAESRQVTGDRHDYPTPPPRTVNDAPKNFVLGPTRPRGSFNQSNGQDPRVTGALFAEVSDSTHTASLLEQLSVDLGNLLNRVDISDCFLNVKGKALKERELIRVLSEIAFRDSHGCAQKHSRCSVERLCR